jgi:adenine deaminase
LVKGHINDLVKRSLRLGFDPVTVIRCCTYNPKKHYHLNTGLLQIGDAADFIIINNLEDFDVQATYIDGTLVARNGETLIPSVIETPINIFIAEPLSEKEIAVNADNEMIRVIKVLDGQLITGELFVKGCVENKRIVSNVPEDILKIVVKNRYSETPPAVGFISGFGLKTGAIASSIAHDSHNIIAIGADDHAIVNAINLIIASKGGVSLVNEEIEMVLPLPFAGIMSNEDGFSIASRYEKLDTLVKDMGSRLNAPFMTLSFMALLVIPELKISDKGLFDGKNFRFTKLFPDKL